MDFPVQIPEPAVVGSFLKRPVGFGNGFGNAVLSEESADMFVGVHRIDFQRECNERKIRAKERFFAGGGKFLGLLSVINKRVRHAPFHNNKIK